MENSTLMPVHVYIDQQEKRAGSPKVIFFGHQERYLTSSVKVMIKFPIINDIPDADDATVPDHQEKCEESPGEIEPAESLPGAENIDLPYEAGNITKNELLFYGAVRDDGNNVLADAAVKLFACYRDGIEKPIAYTFTDNEGLYFINIPEPLDYNELDGFKVRAGKCCRPAEDTIDYPASNSKPDKTSSNENNYNLLSLISNYRNKTIFDMMKR